MPDPSDLPTTGSAEYDGGAIGTVNNAGAQYAASGDMHMDWNFGTQTGDWNVSNFDGKTFGASDVTSLAETSTFSGAVDTGDATGTMSGAFASNGADASAAPAGVMGSFGVTDGGDWSATGTFMGEACFSRKLSRFDLDSRSALASVNAPLTLKANLRGL